MYIQFLFCLWNISALCISLRINYHPISGAKSLQSHLTLCDPMDCSPPGSSVHGILQARIQEWFDIFYSMGSSWPRDQAHGLCFLLVGRFFTTSNTWETHKYIRNVLIFKKDFDYFSRHWSMHNMYETMCLKRSRFDARYWMLGAGALGRPRGMVWGGRRVEGSGWATRVYLWQIHFDIWQN